VIVAVGTVLVALLKLLGVLAEGLLALLAGKGHLEALEERMVRDFFVALGAVEPLAAWERVGQRSVLDSTHSTTTGHGVFILRAGEEEARSREED
jgi:hypothetical protein